MPAVEKEPMRTSVKRSVKSSGASPGHLTYQIGAGVNEHHQGQQNNAQPERQRQVALAGFQYDGSGHYSGNSVNIATYHHHRAHFGTGAAKTGEQNGQ